MAVETFTWCPRIEPVSSPSYRNRTSRFGNGYEQVVGDGPNNLEDSWALTFVVGAADAALIKAFLDRHAGNKSFLWTPPLSGVGFFKSTAPSVTPNGAGVYTLTTTFTQAFAP